MVRYLKFKPWNMEDSVKIPFTLIFNELG